jgi:uncharacterized protein with beta-barrel porin domain
MLGVSQASAQPIPQFIQDQGLTDTNIGRAAIGVQVTCAQLIAIGANQLDGDGEENELWRRCNELVVTAAERNTGQAPIPRTLSYTTDEELLAAFQQVNGEEVQASANLSQTASYDQFSTIGARLSALRGASSTSVTSVAANGGEFMYGSGGGAAADSAAPFGAWGWFVRGTYTSGDRDPSDATSFAGEENGFDYSQYGVTIGIDKRSGNSVWGFALGYNSYEVEMQNAAISGIETPVVEGGTIETDSVNGTFFFDVASENNIYFSALAGFGGQSFDMARNFIYFSNNTDQANTLVVDQQRLMTAAPDGDSFSVAFTLGRSMGSGSVVFDPYIGVTHDRVKIDPFAEADSGNSSAGETLGGMQLAFDEQAIDSVRSRLGFQISNNVNTSFGSVRPMFSAEWFHEFEDSARTIRAKYAAEDDLAGQGDFTAGFGEGCVSCFDIISEAPETDYFVVGLGIAATTQRGFQSFLMLEGLLGHDYLSAYAATVGIRGQF